MAHPAPLIRSLACGALVMTALRNLRELHAPLASVKILFMGALIGHKAIRREGINERGTVNSSRSTAASKNHSVNSSQSTKVS